MSSHRPTYYINRESEKSDDVSDIPLPNELPHYPSLENLPEHILHSSTVETLIGQNEDLMARLSVHLRKNTQLELKIHTLEDDLKKSQQAQQSLQDQMLILREKDNLWRQKCRHIEEKLNPIQEKIELQQIELSELNQSLSQAEMKIQIFNNYQRRIKKYVRPYIEAIKEEYEAQLNKYEHLQRDHAHKLQKIKTLKEQMSESVRLLKQQNKIYESEKIKLVENYELDKKTYTHELQNLRQENEWLKEKSDKIDLLLDSKAALENRAILAERQKEELQQKHREQLKEAQDKLSQYRVEARTAALNSGAFQARSKELEQENSTLRKDVDYLQKQVENLQLLWEQKQADSQKQNERLQSLQKINLEMALRLKQLTQGPASSQSPLTTTQ